MCAQPRRGRAAAGRGPAVISRAGLRGELSRDRPRGHGQGQGRGRGRGASASAAPPLTGRPRPVGGASGSPRPLPPLPSSPLRAAPLPSTGRRARAFFSSFSFLYLFWKSLQGYSHRRSFPKEPHAPRDVSAPSAPPRPPYRGAPPHVATRSRAHLSEGGREPRRGSRPVLSPAGLCVCVWSGILFVFSPSVQRRGARGGWCRHLAGSTGAQAAGGRRSHFVPPLGKERRKEGFKPFG